MALLSREEIIALGSGEGGARALYDAVQAGTTTYGAIDVAFEWDSGTASGYGQQIEDKIAAQTQPEPEPEPPPEPDPTPEPPPSDPTPPPPVVEPTPDPAVPEPTTETTPPPTPDTGTGIIDPVAGGPDSVASDPETGAFSTERLRAAAAQGVTQIPTAEAVTTNLEGTLTPEQAVEQITGVPGAQTPDPVVAPNLTPEQTGAVNQAATPGQIDPATVDTTLITDAPDTQSAQGAVSGDAQAQEIAANIDGTQATAATVAPSPGTTVEAITGTMSPDQIAQAAQVAGVEVARIDRARNQLRNAGLPEAAISALGTDPSTLEAELLNYSEAQRGVIAGLPVEALVSTQMEQLLAGIENGDVPPWAKPAVASVESMLARRGMSVSTVGRDNLFNAIIQASIPIAQSNAQSIKEAAFQQKDFEQRVSLQNAQFKQQATLQNAQNAFNLNIQNMSNEQQAELANASFMQTVSLTEASNKQQTAIQNAVNLTQLREAEVDMNTRIRMQNAQAFLSMDMANLSNEQQSLLIDSQFDQQRMLSDAAAQNANKQFNAQSENQVNQFMANLAAGIEQFNVAQTNAMKQFNTSEVNRTNAINAGNEIQAEQFNSQMFAQVSQFNAQQELAVEQWNSANAQAVEQSNVAWRRQANTADTAAQNAINQQNVQNAFGITQQALASLWQQLRDGATFTFQRSENEQDRRAQLYAVAIGNEAAASNSYDQSQHLVNLANQFFS